LNSKYKIRAVLVLILLLLIPSKEGFGRENARDQLQNEIFLPIIFNTLVNNIPPTQTPRPTQTRTATRTRVPFRSSTPRPTATQTSTHTLTPTVTQTPTYTATITLIPFPPVTIQYPSQTPSITPSPTRTSTSKYPDIVVFYYCALDRVCYLALLLL
jgi:hypothetical protein